MGHESYPSARAASMKVWHAKAVVLWAQTSMCVRLMGSRGVGLLQPRTVNQIHLNGRNTPKGPWL